MSMTFKTIAVKVAGVRVSDLDFDKLKTKVEKQKRQVESLNFKKELEKELEKAIEEIQFLIKKSRPEAFLLFEDFIDMLDEFEYAKRKDAELGKVV